MDKSLAEPENNPVGSGISSRSVMGNKITLKFRTTNRDIFEAIRTGKKRVETRARTTKYKKIATGDVAVLICGKDKFEKQIKKVEYFKTIGNMLKKYKPNEINPFCKTAEELEKTYYSFTDYKRKIKKYGLIALHLK